MNPLYQMYNPAPINNPVAMITAAMRAMNNPAQFVKQQFPDIPENIANDPNQILGYLQQTRGIGNSQIQQIMQNFPMK